MRKMDSEETLFTGLAFLADDFTKSSGKRVIVYVEIEDDGDYPWRAFEYNDGEIFIEMPGVMITKEMW